MAGSNFDSFDRRMARIQKNHQRLSKGYVTRVTRDGLIVARPRRSLLTTLPMRLLLVVLVVGMATKVVLYTNMGAETYQVEVARLAVGTQFEQVGAYILSADQATIWLSERLKELLAHIA